MMIQRSHLNYHNRALGYNHFNPTSIRTANNSVMKEGISAGPEREIPIIGDPTGSSRKVSKVEEGALKDKAKKVAMAGMTAANMYTMADAVSQHKPNPQSDMVRAATALPGAAGWAASAAHYGKKGYDLAKDAMKKNLKEAVAKKTVSKKPVKKEGGSSHNEVMGRVYERATVLAMHEKSGSKGNRSREYQSKINELRQKQAEDIKKLPPSVRDSALKAAESSVNAYIKSLKENHGVDVKDISEVHHTNKGIGHLIGREVSQRDNPHDMVVRIGKGPGSRLHGASLKKTQGTLGNNSHAQFSSHGKGTGIGHQTADIWNEALEKAGLKGMSKAELKTKQGQKEVLDAYRAAQQRVIGHHTESFNAASTEKQIEHLRHLMKLNHDTDVPYDYVNGEKGYAKPVHDLDHAQALSKSKRFAAVSKGTSSHIFDDQGRHILTVEHRATHGPFNSMQANAKLGSLKQPKGEKVEMTKEPQHPVANSEASDEASKVSPVKVKKLLSQYREIRTPETKKREMKKVQTGVSPVTQIPKPGIQRNAFGNQISQQFKSVSQHIGRAVKAMMEEKKMGNPCWKGYKAYGMKKKNGKEVPNCVPVEEQGPTERYTERPTYESAAWQRSAGKDPEGGLNRKGIASYRREHPGSKLSMAVTTKPSKLDPDSKPAKRRKSFCARMGGMKGPMKDEKGRPTRKALSLRKWNCEEENKYPQTAERGINEKHLTPAETKKKEEIVMSMKKGLPGMKKRYGERAKEVLYATATKRAKQVAEEQIDELKAETLGSYVKKASASRKKSLEGSKADIKTWGKRQKGITTAVKKLTDVEEGINTPDRELEASTYKGATGTTHTIHEETKMEHKTLINEAIENILENNLTDMKENLMVALQEKAMEKLEERKKEIAASYFAQ